MADEKNPPPDPPTPIDEADRPIRMTDLPARIRVRPTDQRLPGGGRALLEISLEEYDVPEEGGDVLPFRKPAD